MLHVCWCPWTRAATTQSVIHQWTLATTCPTFSNDFINHLQTMNERWTYIWNELDHFPSSEFVSTPIVSEKIVPHPRPFCILWNLAGPWAQKRFQWRTKHVNKNWEKQQPSHLIASIWSFGFLKEIRFTSKPKLKSAVEFAIKMLLAPFLPQNESFQDPTLGFLIGHGQGP